ncbi:hypothetical protein GOV13_04800 [Candidatus Pacearchaeota archaeon]|nr:hypothetical protein [Candidatus Pacearchaeota archaeon]
MAKKKYLPTILIILSILAVFLGLWGYSNIPELWSDLVAPKSLPFEIEISPDYFDEGNWEYNQNHEIPFLIELKEKFGRNITYLKLPKDSFQVFRKDGGLGKPTSRVNWEDSRSDTLISMGSNSFSSDFKAEGEMAICQNCFIGTSYPYAFTFTISYKEDGGELKSEIFEEIIPIK